jgi:hypothetical protein
MPSSPRYIGVLKFAGSVVEPVDWHIKYETVLRLGEPADGCVQL